MKIRFLAQDVFDSSGSSSTDVEIGGQVNAAINKEMVEVGLGMAHEYKVALYEVVFFDREDADRDFNVEDYPNARAALMAARTHIRSIVGA